MQVNSPREYESMSHVSIIVTMYQRNSFEKTNFLPSAMQDLSNRYEIKNKITFHRIIYAFTSRQLPNIYLTIYETFCINKFEHCYITNPMIIKHEYVT